MSTKTFSESMTKNRRGGNKKNWQISEYLKFSDIKVRNLITTCQNPYTLSKSWSQQNGQKVHSNIRTNIGGKLPEKAAVDAIETHRN